jgi:aryl-alcohol dehydrogenase-like predicted oxidoreductase
MDGRLMEHRPLGASGLEVSALSLGSWRTYERIPREQALAVMRTARELGIDFLDDARYNDETGNAPLATGYSEVIFGELFRAAGWDRGAVVVANKLWWEFWPEQTAEQELDASLERMGFDHVDLIYATRPPEGLGLAEIVGAVASLIAAGKARAWGVANWPPDLIAEAAEIAGAAGVPAPCAAQLAYHVAYRDDVESEAAVSALEAAGAGVVASASLAFGVLSGKYRDPAATGRVAGGLDAPFVQQALAAVPALEALAAESATTPAALAIAFALAGPRVASVLYGATTPDQVRENARALEVPAELLPELRSIGA